jgi:hypothetical protein
VSDVLGVSVPDSPLGSTSATIDNGGVQVRRAPLTGSDSVELVCGAGDVESLMKKLESAGATRCGPEAVEMARVEFGTPLFGRDITADNFPQELDRNASAISFTKGCYLGQETVARIDALGHVNRLLVGCSFEPSTIPEIGMELRVEGKSVGRITSAVYSPKIQAPLALALVRREHVKIGTMLSSPVGDAIIVKLPVQSSAKA